MSRVQKLLELRKRIRTVENIKTVTGTLATVSAAKLSRTRARAEHMHDYAEKLREILLDQQAHIARMGGDITYVSPLLPHRPVRSRTLLLITGDRGMCGGYNLSAERFALEFWNRGLKRHKRVDFITKGVKGETYLRRRRASIVHAEGWSRQGVTPKEVRSLLGIVLDRYLSGETDEVWILYTRFYSPVRRRPMLLRLLPVEVKAQPRPPHEGPPVEPTEVEEWSYEPSFSEVIHDLLLVALLVQMHYVLLESYASEHSARMVTMKEANERADKTLHECRIAYNRLRREAITIDLLGALFAGKVAEEEPTMPTLTPTVAEGGATDASG